MVETFAPAFIDTFAPYDGNSILNVATVVAKTLAQILSDVGKVAAIPGLGPAGDLVKGIIVHCQKAANNKKELVYLSQRCYQFFMVLGTNCERREQSYVDGVVKKAYPTLQSVHDKIQSWNGYNKIKKFVMAGIISSGIRSCEKLLDVMMMQTGLDIALQNADWQVAAEAARRRDQENLRRYLDDFLQAQLDTAADVHVFKQEMVALILQIEKITESNEFIENAIRYVMDCFQKCIENSEEENGNRGALKFKLLNIQQATGQLPSNTQIPPVLVRRLGSHPEMSPFQQYDIWKGTWSGGLEVAIKALRIHKPSKKNLERFWREARCWREVWEVDQGHHFLEFIGAVEEQNGVLSLVSPWQSNGTAIDYCKHHNLDCTDIIRGIAAGLQILHNWRPKSIVCGDLRGKNIMIGSQGQPLIADFSLSKVLEDSTGVPFTQSGMSESYRWFAPEICGPRDCVVSTASDVYSFGMTILELTTAEIPFVEERKTTAVLFKVVDRQRPARPVGMQYIHRGLTDHMWQLVEDCWRQEPAERCSIDDFIRRLG